MSLIPFKTIHHESTNKEAYLGLCLVAWIKQVCSMIALSFQISQLFVIVNHSLFHCRDNTQVLGLCGWSLLFGTVLLTLFMVQYCLKTMLK